MKKLILLSAACTLCFQLLCFHSSAQLLSLNGTSYYINGLNIPWNNYNLDFGTDKLLGVNKYDSSVFESVLTKCEAYGVNCVRIWVHTLGCASPDFDTAGNVTGLDSAFFPNLDDFMNRALKHNIMVIPAIWDFNMTNNDTAAWGPDGGLHANLIEDSSMTRGYINNAFIPIVEHYANQCNLLAYDLINEPEWAMNVPFAGNTSQVVPASDMQRFVGMLAEAVHQHSSKMCTVGSACLRYNSDEFSVTTPNSGNYWKDAAIQSAYNRPLAHLDFYEIHYYDWMDNTVYYFDPYKSWSTLSYWELDKPTLIGESQGNSANHLTSDELYNGLIHNWAGILFWSYTASADSMGCFSDFDDALLTFRNTDPSLINFNSTGCSTMNIKQVSPDNAVSIYPNPVTTTLTVEIPKAAVGTKQEAVSNIAIYNLIGIEVYSTTNYELLTTNNITDIDVSALPSGVYMVEVRTEKGVEVRKFIKE